MRGASASPSSRWNSVSGAARKHPRCEPRRRPDRGAGAAATHPSARKPPLGATNGPARTGSSSMGVSRLHASRERQGNTAEQWGERRLLWHHTYNRIIRRVRTGGCNPPRRALWAPGCALIAPCSAQVRALRAPVLRRLTPALAVSGSPPEEPVVSTKTGHLYERRLIEKALAVRATEQRRRRRERCAC